MIPSSSMCRSLRCCSTTAVTSGCSTHAMTAASSATGHAASCVSNKAGRRQSRSIRSAGGSVAVTPRSRRRRVSGRTLRHRTHSGQPHLCAAHHDWLIPVDDLIQAATGRPETTWLDRRKRHVRNDSRLDTPMPICGPRSLVTPTLGRVVRCSAVTAHRGVGVVAVGVCKRKTTSRTAAPEHSTRASEPVGPSPRTTPDG